MVSRLISAKTYTICLALRGHGNILGALAKAPQCYGFVGVDHKDS